MPANVREVCEAEFKKLRNSGSQNPESNVIRNYLELVLDLPWGNPNKIIINQNYLESYADETLSIEKAR